MYLKKGDLIAIVSPSRAISLEEIEASIELLEQNGFKVHLGSSVFNKHHQFAGTDEEKVRDIQACIDNPDVKAIWSSRGGYGSARIIDQLDFSSLSRHFKWFIGYSDFTVFHSHLHAQLNVPTVHGTMPINVHKHANSAELDTNQSLMDALYGKELSYALAKHSLNKAGNASGMLVGGNLSILYSLCGSKSDIDTEGKILFIEDLDEYLYHIDRMMVNLKRTGKLQNLAALVVGGMSDMNDNTIPYGKSAEEIILEHTVGFNYPIYFGFHAGHVQPNLTLRFGMNAKICDNSLILPA